MATTVAPTPAVPPVAGGVVLAAALLAAAMGIEIARERVAVDPGPLPPTMWMRSPALMDRLSLGFDAIVADVYWMRAVVYYGGQRREVSAQKNYDLLYPLLDITTSLDPGFLLAYRMGAIFLSEPYPGGPGRPDLALALLEKGLRARPTAWELPHDIGFVHFWSYRDYTTAARWFERASAIPGSPAWLKPVIAGMIVRSGDRQTARLLWSEMVKSDQAMMKGAAELRLAQLDAMDQIDALHSLVARVTLATGRRPETWRELIASGRLRGVPADPSGTPYLLDPATARVTVSSQSPLYPMPDQLEGQ